MNTPRRLPRGLIRTLADLARLGVVLRRDPRRPERVETWPRLPARTFDRVRNQTPTLRVLLDRHDPIPWQRVGRFRMVRMSRVPRDRKRVWVPAAALLADLGIGPRIIAYPAGRWCSRALKRKGVHS